MHTGRFTRGYSTRAKKKQKRHTSKTNDKGAKKANTPRQQPSRWTIQPNSKSVSDWRRSSRRPMRGRMVQLYRYSSTSSTSTRRCSSYYTLTRNVVFYCLLVKANNARFSRQLLFLFCGHFERSGVQATNSCSAPNSIYQTR